MALLIGLPFAVFVDLAAIAAFRDVIKSDYKVLSDGRCLKQCPNCEYPLERSSHSCPECGLKVENDKWNSTISSKSRKHVQETR